MPPVHSVAIVGAGPAGSACAIALAQLAPQVARDAVLLEKARFPRPKPCGGGLTARAEEALARLGVRADVPSWTAGFPRYRFPGGEITLTSSRPGRVVRRDEFDASLARSAVRFGVELREGVKLLGLAREGDAFRLETSQGEIRAKVVVGADGVGSRVRRFLGRTPGPSSRLAVIETDPTDKERADLARGVITFDLRCVTRGVRGYIWSFPCQIGGELKVSRGIMDGVGHRAARPDFCRILTEQLAEEGVDLGGRKLTLWPERHLRLGDRLSAPGVLLVGDAAGLAERLLGEGIAFGLASGEVAAEVISRAFSRNDFAFSDYKRRLLLREKLGAEIFAANLLADLLYGEGGGKWLSFPEKDPETTALLLRCYTEEESTRRNLGKILFGGVRHYARHALFSGLP